MRDDWNTMMLPLNISEKWLMQQQQHSSLSDAILEPPSSDTNFPSFEEWEATQLKLKQLQEENVRLQAVVNDVTEINKRWQRYDSERQSYIEKILTTIQEQKKQLEKMQLAVDDTKPKNCECNKIYKIEQLHLEHVKTLELQLKRYRQDWIEERQEKLQLKLENETLQVKMRDLMRQWSKSQAKLCEFRLIEMGRMRCCNVSTSSARYPISQPPGQLLSRGTTLSLDDEKDEHETLNKLSEKVQELDEVSLTSSKSFEIIPNIDNSSSSCVLDSLPIMTKPHKKHVSF